VRFNKQVTQILEAIADLPPVPAPAPAIIQQAHIIRNIDVVAAALIGEAGGEGERGMHAVMNVIINRCKGQPDLVRSAVQTVVRPKQFSFFNNYNNGQETMEDIINKAKKHTSWNKAIEIASLGLEKKLDDITNGATHYHVYTGKSKVTPKWSSPEVGGRNREAVITNTVGHHVFLKNVR